MARPKRTQAPVATQEVESSTRQVVAERSTGDGSTERVFVAQTNTHMLNAADRVRREFLRQADFDPSAAIREILGMGKEAWDQFTRTDLLEKDINRWARIITLSLRGLKGKEGWENCPWLRMPRRVAFLSIKSYLLVSRNGLGRTEGVEVYTNVVVPEATRGQEGKRRGS